VIVPERFPALTRLDLTRLGGIGPFVSTAMARQLRAIRVALRSSEDLEALEGAVANMPALVEVEVVGFLPGNAPRAPRLPDSVKLTYANK
jgi:hypothetical protein